MSTFTAEQKLAAVDRELAYRRRVYVKRIEDRLMSQGLADYQIAIFEAVRQDYVAAVEKERLL